jgi:hypothetical protein
MTGGELLKGSMVAALWRELGCAPPAALPAPRVARRWREQTGRTYGTPAVTWQHSSQYPA